MASTVSACIVLYHADDDVFRAVQSVLDSTLPVDLFIADNSPQCDTAERIRAMAPHAVILPQEGNLGFGKANNAVLPHLGSRYHLLVNPDVSFDADLIGRMADWMDRHPECAVLTPRVFFPDGTEQFLPKKQPTIRYLLGGRLEKLGEPFRSYRREYTLCGQEITSPTPVEFATGCFLMIRTELFRELGGFDDRFFLYQEDSDLSRRALQKGQIIYHPDMRITHAWHRENTKTLKGNLRQIHSMIKFFMKWGWKW